MTRRLSLLTLVVVLAIGSVAPAYAGDAEEDLEAVKNRISSLEQEIQNSNAQRSDLAKEVVAAKGRLESAQAAVDDAQQDVDEIAGELAEREVDLAEVRAELAERFIQLAQTRAIRDEAQTEAESSVLFAYMRGGTDEPAIAFSASEIADISVGIGYLDVLTGNSSAAADAYAEIIAIEEAEEARVRLLEAGIDADVQGLEDTKHDAELLAQDLAIKRASLDTEFRTQTSLLARVDAAIAEFEGELASFEREESSIRATIAAAAAKAAAKAKAAADAKAAAESAAKATAAPSSGTGAIVWPIRGRITSPFGWRIHPITYTKRLHTGIDIDGAYGQTIVAADSGTVIFSGVKGGYGNSIMIDHGNGMVTLYAHQQWLGKSVGDWVSRGGAIGAVGSSGDSTGPHLHFEVRINGVPNDPMRYL